MKTISELLSEAWNKRRVGDYENARRLTFEAQDRCDPEDHHALGRIYHIYMQIESDHDQYLKAIEYSKKSVRHYELSHQADRIAHSTRHLADLQRKLKNYPQAELNYRKALDYYRHDLDVHSLHLANALRGFALLMEQTEKKQEAINAWEEVKQLYGSLALSEGVDEAKVRLEQLMRKDS